MIITRFTFWFGAALLTMGVLGFVTPLSPLPNALQNAMSAGGIKDYEGYRYFLNIFAVNGISNLVHALIGVWSMASQSSFSESTRFCRTAALIFCAFTIMGFIPKLNTVFGWMPLFGNNIWLHALMAGLCAYYGFTVGGLVRYDSQIDADYPRKAA